MDGWEKTNLIQLTIISTTVGKNPIEEMDQPSRSTKTCEMQAWVKSEKPQNYLGMFPRQVIQHLNNANLCHTTNAEESEVGQFCEDLQLTLK